MYNSEWMSPSYSGVGVQPFSEGGDNLLLSYTFRENEKYQKIKNKKFTNCA